MTSKDILRALREPLQDFTNELVVQMGGYWQEKQAISEPMKILSSLPVLAESTVLSI